MKSTRNINSRCADKRTYFALKFNKFLLSCFIVICIKKNQFFENERLSKWRMNSSIRNYSPHCLVASGTLKLRDKHAMKVISNIHESLFMSDKIVIDLMFSWTSFIIHVKLFSSQHLQHHIRVMYPYEQLQYTYSTLIWV